MKTIFITVTCVLGVSLALQVQPLLHARQADARPGLYHRLSDTLAIMDANPLNNDADESISSSTVTGASSTEFNTTTDGNSDLTTTSFVSTEVSTEASPSTTTTTTTTEAPSNNLSGGAIAGIVIGSIAGVALIIGGIYFMKVKGMLCFA